MAVAAADLLSPQGPVNNVMFPDVAGNVLSARLDAYIARAAADSRLATVGADSQDAAIRALALHFVFQDAYTTRLYQPVEVERAEKGTHRFTDDQIDSMRQLAQSYLDEFIALVPVQAGGVGRTLNQSVSNVYTF